MTILHGYGITLRPLVAEDADALIGTVDDDFWRGMTTPVPRSADDLRANFAAAIADGDREPFAVLDADGVVVGTTSFYGRGPVHVEVGHTFYDRRVWGTYVNPAAKLLMFTHAFDGQGLSRVALRLDARNARSKAAVEKLGAVFEGRLRKNRLASDGVISDTLYYSITDDEWPAVREGLLARLSALAPQPVPGPSRGPDSPP